MYVPELPRGFWLAQLRVVGYPSISCPPRKSLAKVTGHHRNRNHPGLNHPPHTWPQWDPCCCRGGHHRVSPHLAVPSSFSPHQLYPVVDSPTFLTQPVLLAPRVVPEEVLEGVRVPGSGLVLALVQRRF
jgi:hypothetical protein